MTNPVHQTAPMEPLVAIAEQRLAAAGIPEPHREAVTLVQLAMAFYLSGNRHSLDELVEGAVQERESRRSLARIAGFKHFHGLALKLGDDVYEPCASSERLLDHALVWASGQPERLRILDLGTGAGNLLLAALRLLPNATGVGVDCSSASITLARDNATRHELSQRCLFLEGDAHDLNLTKFDLVMSTLPWVPTSQLHNLMPEVKLYDPVRALDGGRDGLNHIRRLAQAVNRMLTADGRAFVQVGYERLPAAQELFLRGGCHDVTVLRDGYGFPMGLRIGARC